MVKAPQNLVKAVERLNPQAVLLLDTNTIMDYPRLESYEIAAQGPSLLVVPEVAYSEVMNIANRKGTSESKRQKAWRAIHAMDRLLSHNIRNGIELTNGHWVITAKSPPRPKLENMSAEEYLLWKNLKEFDTTLLRLADACVEDIPDTRTVLVTSDKDLTRAARVKGVPACPLPDLRSPEGAERLLADVRPSEVVSVDDIASVLDSAEKRPVKIAMTLEGIDSEGERLIARGIARLAYDGEAYSLRWTYRYTDADKLDATSLLEMIGNTGFMPVENLDFMGKNAETIPEEVRRFACAMLESAGWAQMWHQAEVGALARAAYAVIDREPGFGFGWLDGNYSLQSPLARARLAFTYMEAVHWGYYCGGGRLPWAWQSDGKDIEDDIKDLYYEYYNRCEDLMNLTTYDFDTFMSLYRDAFEMYIVLVDKVGKLEFTTEGKFGLTQETDVKLSWARARGEPVGDPELGLRWLLNVALDSWPIGHTREEEFSYNPFP